MYAVADPAPGDAARCPVHPDHEGLAHQIALGLKAPGTAVVAVVAVVAHGEVTALRHLPCTRVQTAEIVRVYHQLVLHGADRLHLQPRRQRDTGAHLGIRPYILLRHGGAVYEDGLVVVLDAVAGQTHDALDVIGRRVLRVPELHHVAALRRGAHRRASINQMTPHTTSAITIIAAKSIYFFPACSTAMKASCGISTVPSCFMRFLPAFCFSNNLRLRDTSPP